MKHDTVSYMSLIEKKTVFVGSQRRRLEAGNFYLCSENKGADQLHGQCAADLRLCFRICKKAGFLMMWLVYEQSVLHSQCFYNVSNLGVKI